MSKVAELKADIPLTGNGVIINVYSSIEDMSNEYYTNDYILVEAEYDGEYHKNCPIAVTYSRTNDAFNEFGTEWTLTDADGKTCYVMTEPYFPHECIVTYEAPSIYLYYDAERNDSIIVKAKQTILPTTTLSYILRWTDSCGNSGVIEGVADSGTYRISVSDSDLEYEFDNSTGEFTAENILAKSGGGTSTVATVYVQISVNGQRGTSNHIAILMEYEDTDMFKDYNLWVLYREGRGGSRQYDITPAYVWTSMISGAPYYFKNPLPFLITSYASYEEAIAAGCINPERDELAGTGYYVLSMPDSSDQLFFYVEGLSGIKTATVGSNVDLSDGTGDLG